MVPQRWISDCQKMYEISDKGGKTLAEVKTHGVMFQVDALSSLNECEIVTLNYYITQCTGNSISWRQDGCSRDSQHPAEGALKPPIEKLPLGI